MHRDSVIRTGVTAGIIGATVVVILFLIVDITRGQPLAVPAGLGHLVLHGVGMGEGTSRAAKIVAYTIFHYAAFAAVGIVAAAVARRAESQPTILAGALVAFVMAEIGFTAMSLMLSQSRTLGVVTWYQVAAGNLLAAAAMGWYLWKKHPGLSEQARTALGDVKPD